jgi:CheY-like chemotaxis protein
MKRILIVDDETDVTEVLVKKLKASGYETKVASNGQVAVSLAHQNPYDLILMDIVMPVMDGYQACQELKKDEKTSGIPILLVTTKELDPQGVAQRKEDLEVAGYVAKPASFEVLLAKIKSIIG